MNDAEEVGCYLDDPNDFSWTNVSKVKLNLSLFGCQGNRGLPYSPGGQQPRLNVVDTGGAGHPGDLMTKRRVGAFSTSNHQPFKAEQRLTVRSSLPGSSTWSWISSELKPRFSNNGGIAAEVRTSGSYLTSALPAIRETSTDRIPGKPASWYHNGGRLEQVRVLR